MMELDRDSPSPPPAEPSDKKKLTRKANRKSSDPSVAYLIVQAVAASKERSGVTFNALKKGLAAEGYDVQKHSNRIKNAIKSLVTKGNIIQVKGTGAAGSFKMSKKLEEARYKTQINIADKPSTAPKAPAAKSPKRQLPAPAAKSPKGGAPAKTSKRPTAGTKPKKPTPPKNQKATKKTAKRKRR